MCLMLMRVQRGRRSETAPSSRPPTESFDTHTPLTVLELDTNNKRAVQRYFKVQAAEIEGAADGRASKEDSIILEGGDLWQRTRLHVALIAQHKQPPV